MNMVKRVVLITAFLILATSGIYYLFISNSEVEKMPKEQQLLGGDKDEHGCIGSAGYAWCETKQKCLREWEEKCELVPTVSGDSLKEEIITQVKAAIIEKNGPEAEKLNITVSEIEGNFAKGGASQVGLGGGMWFSAKKGNVWKLVWDGNGIINCDSLTEFPDFPDSLIPQCFDSSMQEMIDR
jgi:hypothetical protein